MLNYRFAVHGTIVLAITACTAGPVEPTVKPGSSPTQSSTSASPVATPTPSPSVTAPMPSPQGASAENLELYAHQVSCEPLEKSLAENKLKLHDISVSADGNDIYVLYDRQALREVSIFAPKKVVPHQVIYKLEGKQLVPDVINQKISDTCLLMSEIEKDAQDNLYFVKPNFVQNTPAFVPLNGYTFLQYRPKAGTFTSVAAINLGEPDPSPSSHPDARHLKGLQIPVSQDLSFYYKLESAQYDGGNALIQKLKVGAEKEDLVSLSSSEMPYSFSVVDSMKILYRDWFLKPPYPFFTYRTFDDQGNLNPQLTQVIENNRSNPYDFRVTRDKKFIYASDSEKTHSILRIDVSKQTIENFVGSGSAGFADGKATAAQFNQPGQMDVDAQGNLYVIDVGNQAIRKVTPSGEVTTIYSEK